MGAVVLLLMACMPAEYAELEPESIPPVPAFEVELGAVMACADPRDGKWSAVREFVREECPTGAVSRLRWRPGNHRQLLLAAVAADHSVRLFGSVASGSSAPGCHRAYQSF